MRKQFLGGGFFLVAVLLSAVAFGQPATPTETPLPTPTLVSTVTPTPGPSTTPNDSGTVSVPTTLASPSPSVTPVPSPVAPEPGVVESTNTFKWSEKGAPVFAIDQAVITALQKNPDVLRALHEIERTKGVVIEIRAQLLPHIGPSGTINWVDHNIHENNSFSTFGSTPTPTPAGTPTGAGIGGVKNLNNDLAYNIKVTGTQLIFNGTSVPSLRGSFFQRDAAYFALRNSIDQVISTVKTEFYQVVVNRELIVVQEESVRLLESQLKDQQNRFEAGTVPRFNVLQAQVQLYNQIPQLITARNNYRISILQLAKTLGLDFNPARGIAAPLRVVGQLTYTPRNIDILADIEAAKRHRPFLKQARANVLNQIEQVHVALGNWMPTVTGTGGGEWESSQINSSWGDIRKGWIATGQASWPIWDSGQVWGQVKQQRAILQETKITYDDDVRQVELEVQQAASNLLQDRELIKSTEKTVEQAEEAVRLAKARLDAGAGTQLDVLNAQVQLTTAQSTRLQALFGYNSALAEFDRVTGAESVYTEKFDGIAPRATKSRRYDTGSDKDAEGKARNNPLR